MDRCEVYLEAVREWFIAFRVNFAVRVGSKLKGPIALNYYYLELFKLWMTWKLKSNRIGMMI